MANPSLTVKIGADVSKLEQAMRGTEAVLSSFDRAVTASGTKLQSTFNGFSGSKIISEANAMVSAYDQLAKNGIGLTEREQRKLNATVTEAIAKYDAMGMLAPADLHRVRDATQQADKATKGMTGTLGSLKTAFLGAFGGFTAANLITSGINAIRNMTGELFTMADALVSLSDKTGLSIGYLQKLKYAAEQSGTSLEVMTNGVAMLQDKLGARDKSASGAIRDLKLSIDTLRNSSPEEAFDAIMKALAGVENVNDRMAMARDIFGKAGGEMLRVAANYGELTRRAEELGLVIDEETVRAVENLGDQFDTLKTVALSTLAKGLQPFMASIAQFTVYLAESAPKALASFKAELLDLQGILLKLSEQGNRLAAILARLTPAPGMQSMAGIFTASADNFAKLFAQNREEFEAMRAIAEGKMVPYSRSGAKPPTLPGTGTPGFYGGGGDAADLAKRLREAEEAVAKLTTQLVAQNPITALSFGAGGLFSAKGSEFVNPDKLIAGKTPGADLFGGFSTLFGGSKATSLATDLFGTLSTPFIESSKKIAASLSNLLVTSPNVKPGATMGKGLFDGAFDKEFGAKLGSTVLAAFTGGGDVGKSVGGLFGGSFTKGIGEVVKDKLGGTLGAAFGSIIPGLGTMLGGMVGGLFGKLFGGDSKKTKQMRDDFIAQAGGIDQIRKMADYAGVSVDRLLSTKKSKEFEREVKKLEAAFKATQERVAKLADELGQLGAKGGLLGGDLAKRLTADLDKPEVQNAFAGFVTANLDAAAKGMTAFLSASKDLPITATSAEALGSALGGVFQRMQDMGASVPEALAALGPAVEALQARLAAAGLSGGEAFDQLREQAALAAGEVTGPLLAGVDGLTRSMVGLANSGILTEGMFAGLSEQVAATFDKLVEQGVSGDAAIRAMGPSLQRIYELQDKYGWAVDANTEKLINMGQEQGVVGDAMKDTQTQILDVLKLIAKALGADIPEAADKAGRAFEEMGRKIPSMPGGLDYQGERAHSGAMVLAKGLRRFHSGGLANDELLAVLQSGEAVLNKRAVQKLGSGLVSRLNRSEVGGGSSDAGLAALATELAALREEQAASSAMLPSMLARAVRDAVLTAGR